MNNGGAFHKDGPINFVSTFDQTGKENLRLVILNLKLDNQNENGV